MPGIVPPAPPPMMWSMRFLPSAPLEFASPVGKRGVFELRRMRVDSSVEAHRKTTRARNSSAWWVWASMTRDRKSTRLNSSHLVISNAVFCLKKKIQVDANKRISAFCNRPFTSSISLSHPRYDIKPFPTAELKDLIGVVTCLTYYLSRSLHTV